MEKNTQGLVAIFAILSLLIGFTLGAVLMGEDTETIKEVEVEKIVNVSVEKIVEIEAPSALDKAVIAFMNAVENEEDEAENDVDILDDMNYNFDEVSIYKLFDDYSIVVSDDGDVETINFDIRLKFKDSHDSEKTTYDVTVIFEEDEDTIVIVA